MNRRQRMPGLLPGQIYTYPRCLYLPRLLTVIIVIIKNLL
ncbi:unnamed protein product [Acanthoscelides obtectus]|uniref:Uncharacterized protein n=1 Tax=Acanthoscelides obtectus TaxID=200917 RepID=A0A9P0LUL8_ACAOB|nr:unnamed protein product [Acanthoscelides obtectus]